ncbi:response regulator transcription factor [Acuticoccus sp. 2012]|uniref:Response regulator transcription factor n=1 Tax=Acuticoccus mangrovi TaxID=2796142 RepID=A0A934ILM0_9HYPH|nr:response regulator transcription factor [Acuticoccus mangrovi]
MSVLIADDHDLVRDMLVAFLEREGDFDIVSVPDYPAATEAVGRHGPFDLILLDYQMPGMSGLAGLSEAIALNAPQPVALMSGIADRRVAQEALDAGAAGFVPKTMPGKSLVHAVRIMLAGEQYAPITFMNTAADDPANAIAERLSQRERDVLDRLCRGFANKEIARELGLAEVTVKLHVRTLCRKLDAKNRTHAAMIAKQQNLF